MYFFVPLCIGYATYLFSVSVALWTFHVWHLVLNLKAFQKEERRKKKEEKRKSEDGGRTKKTVNQNKMIIIIPMKRSQRYDAIESI